MVSNSVFAAVCVFSGIHEHFLHKSSALQKSIREYVTELKASQAKEYAEAETEGRPPGQFWLELSAPKVLSDIMESITGALYVSDSFSLTGAEVVFNKLLKPFYDKHITLKTLSPHPTKALFELFQRQGCRKFKAICDKKDKKTELHFAYITVHDVILSSAEDADPNIAGRRASFFALDALEGDSGFFARTCDCRTSMASPKGTTAKKSSIERQLEFDEDDGYADQDSELEEGMIVE
ncbi:hypothetical protein H0H81_007902 [Sphagnurus paluster]|uniref:RNase III domain-containing protein n=1 Tax=Sphagnurus paluster TaxID=117069 RepID=A0A9P7FVB1_9AGAR|nr:hypothetical protein H0H81_007902 [Sphagnurus paluster]